MTACVVAVEGVQVAQLDGPAGRGPRARLGGAGGGRQARRRGRAPAARGRAGRRLGRRGGRGVGHWCGLLSGVRVVGAHGARRLRRCTARARIVRTRIIRTSVRRRAPRAGDEPVLGLSDVVEDLQRQRVHPLARVERRAVHEGDAEEQRRGLARGAGHREQRAGDDAGQRRRQDDLEDDPPARGAERQRAPRAAVSGTRLRTTSAERVTTGSISSASATAPFQAANVPPTFVTTRTM